jgi:hypothetical protein
MLTLRVAATRPEIHALRRRVEALLDDARPSHWAILAVCTGVLADVIADAPLDIREDLIGVINGVLEI